MGIYLLAGLLGALFVTFAKMSALKKDFEVANQAFVTKKFFEKEWIGIASNLITILILAVILPEILNFKPELENFVAIMFVVTGAIGSWVFSLFLGGTKKYIRRIVDEKKNIADGIQKAD